jgi:guanylate kinase
MPPGIRELETRLRNRLTETEESLKKRIDKAEYEMGFAGSFDKIIINDNLETALEEAINAVKSFLES